MLSRLLRHPLLFAGLALFVGISALVVSGVVLPWDIAALEWMGTQRTAIRTEAMLAVTFLGDGALEVPLALVAVGLLWRIASRRAAAALFFGALSGEVIYILAKASFQRDRPTIIEQLSGAGWYSYPSGHAMLAPIIWSLALLLFVPVAPRRLRWVLIALAVLIPIGIAVSRVYLGVHYPSDVLGALALGSAWMAGWLVWSRSASTSSSASTM